LGLPEESAGTCPGYLPFPAGLLEDRLGTALTADRAEASPTIGN
jgi:hypothetical protein